MHLRKCPRCELNYITDAEDYCKICKREMKGEGAVDEVELCSVCNEAPCMPGKDVCKICYREMNDNVQENDTDREEDVPSDPEDAMGIESVSTMEEIIPDMDEETPPAEFSDIDTDLSTEQMREEEDGEDEDDEKEEI